MAEPRLADHRAERVGIILAEGGWGVQSSESLADLRWRQSTSARRRSKICAHAHLG
jgi:hypothetical protein